MIILVPLIRSYNHMTSHGPYSRTDMHSDLNAILQQALRDWREINEYQSLILGFHVGLLLTLIEFFCLCYVW
jgi:hypothetical protein